MTPEQIANFEKEVIPTKTYLWGQRPSTLTEAERLGIPKGERHNI